MPPAAPPRTEYKTLLLDRASVKARGSAREFTGWASRFDDLDLQGDIVRRGAFTATLRQRSSRPLLWNHDAGIPIGFELEMVEDAAGLKGTWKLSKTAAADDAYQLLQDGAVTGLSIGFIPRETQPGPNGTRELLSIDLLEISVVAVPALDSARITAVKSAQGATTMNAAARMAQRGYLTPLPDNRASSLAQKLLQSAEYKQLVQGSDLRSEHSPVRMRVEIADVSVLAQKALVTSINTPGALTIDQTSEGTPALLVDFLPTVRTTENSVMVARQTARPAALTVIEATATTGNTGTKPESGVAWDEVIQPMEIISAWVPVTRQLIADAAGFEALIDSELSYAVRLALEAQVITGNGVRPNLAGIVGMAGVNTVSVGAAGALAAIAHAISLARKLGRRQPNIIAMDADSWDALTFARENTATGDLGGSALGPPGLLGAPSLWGIPVIPDTEMAAGTAIVGATSTATIYERLGATVVLGTINTMFIRNMVAVRCEMRGALGVRRPAAWSSVSGLPTS